MKLHRYGDHQRLHIVTKDVISLSISVLLLFRHYRSHKITFGAPSSGGVLCSACGAFILSLFTGSEHTLHGELDLMSEGVGLTIAERLADVAVDAEEPTDSETNEEEETARLEETMVKEAAALQRQSSVIAQTITFGWTQFNRHRDLSPYIPTVFIDAEKFVVHVYNPVSDSLLIYNYPLAFIWDKVEPLNEKYSGIFILWLILNYRLFFRRDIDIIEHSCKFKQHVRIEFYEDLKEYRNYIRTRIPGVQFGRTTVGIKQLKKKKGKETDKQDGDTKRRKLCS